MKATRSAGDGHLKGLRALKEGGMFRELAIVSLDVTDREPADGICILHWSRFLEVLWQRGFAWQRERRDAAHHESSLSGERAERIRANRPVDGRFVDAGHAQLR